MSIIDSMIQHLLRGTIKMSKSEWQDTLAAIIFLKFHALNLKS